MEATLLGKENMARHTNGNGKWWKYMYLRELLISAYVSRRINIPYAKEVLVVFLSK